MSEQMVITINGREYIQAADWCNEVGMSCNAFYQRVARDAMPDAIKVGRIWMMPKDAVLPDLRKRHRPAEVVATVEQHGTTYYIRRYGNASYKVGYISRTTGRETHLPLTVDSVEAAEDYIKTMASTDLMHDLYDKYRETQK